MPALSSENRSSGSVFQNSVYIGINIQDILYGIQLFLYFKTIILLTRRKARKRSNLFYALFSSMMMFSVTVWVAAQTIFGEKMWLLQAGYPGGPNAYWMANDSVWYMDWGTTAVIVLQLMTDALMIYRCRIIWDSYYIVIIPITLWLGTLALGIFVDWVTSSPGGNFFTGIASDIGLTYYVISVFLNTTLTCMICYPLVQHARMVQEHIGREYASLHFTVVTIIVESVLPYTLSGIAFLISFGVGSPTSAAFMCVYFLMMSISPQVLILRMVSGRAWDKDTLKQPSSTIEFSPETQTESHISSSSGAGVHLQTLSNVYLPDEYGKIRTSQVELA